MDYQLTHYQRTALAEKYFLGLPDEVGGEITCTTSLGYARGSNGDQSGESAGVKLGKDTNGNVP